MLEITLDEIQFVDAIERLAAAATEAPWNHDPERVWRFNDRGPSHVAVLATVDDEVIPVALTGMAVGATAPESEADAAFIAAARTAVPQLVDLVRRLLDERIEYGLDRTRHQVLNGEFAVDAPIGAVVARRDGAQ